MNIKTSEKKWYKTPMCLIGLILIIIALIGFIWSYFSFFKPIESVTLQSTDWFTNFSFGFAIGISGVYIIMPLAIVAVVGVILLFNIRLYPMTPGE